MSHKKISDTLEFDDDIDFEGLEEYDKEISEYSEEVEAQLSDIESDSPEEPLCEKEADSAFLPVFEDISEDNNVCEPTVHVSCDNENAEMSAAVSVADTEHSDKFVRRFCIINAIISIATLCLLGGGLYFGIGYLDSMKTEIDEKSAEIAELEGKNSTLEAEYLEVMNIIENQPEESVGIPETDIERGKILFYDSSVGYSWIPVISGIEQNTYKKENFAVDDRYRMTYTVDEEVSSYFGIDVSSYQGDIDWQLVKEDGVEFAFLRIGYRGYGEEGKLCPDEFFVQNYEAAHDAGIDLGIYFFSQATSVAEAVEEAEFVLSLLENRPLEYPIVFDWENVHTGDPEDIPRTEDVMPQTLTLSAIAFCETVKDAGYDAMIYTNKKLATIKYDLRQLSEYPVWLAYYDTELDYYYDFDIWQYGTGQVDGIEGEVDVNIAIIK